MLDGTDRQHQQPVRVLVVDDNEADFVFVRDLLCDDAFSAYRVDWVASSSSALLKVAEREHDIYLLDYTLGSLTGVEILDIVRQTGMDAPVIMLTGMADDALDRRAMEAGATDFMTKSEITEATLKRAMRYALEHARLLRDMARTAKEDALTGLPNRRHFMDFLEGAICRSRRSGVPLGLLLIDLDHFKEVNDQYGHDAGDQLLSHVGDTLRRAIRGGDLVARLGGDEFAVVLDNLTGHDDAIAVAEKLLHLLANCDPLFAESSPNCQVSASIGVALYPETGDSVTAMVKAADTALYEAKAKGRNRYQCFERDMQIQALRRAELHRALESALANQEFDVHYQVQYDTCRQRLAGVEALLRWQRNHEPLSPAEFVPIAECTGLIHPLGEWVLARACAQFADWRRRGVVPDSARVAVNVSACQLSRGDFVDVVARTLDQCGLPAQALELEITESSPLHDMAGVVEQLTAIHALGVRIALDDFGTGHSSLTHLQRLPVQTLKIDRSFVRRCARGGNEQVLVEGTLAIAQALGLEVVAEGVEVTSQRDFLSDHGCQLMQGFLFHRPAGAGATEQVLRRLRDTGVPSLDLAGIGGSVN